MTQIFILFFLFISTILTLDPYLIDQANGRKHLYPSSWPIDHGDSARNKYSSSGGISYDFDANKLKIVEKSGLKSPQWIVTGKKEDLFVLSGFIMQPVLWKFNSTSLQISQQIKLNKTLYLGGLCVHANSNVYIAQGNILYTFWRGNLENSTISTLPLIRGGTAQTNGLTVAGDGNLIIKQWPYNVDDIKLLRHGAAFVIQVEMALVIGGFVFYNVFLKVFGYAKSYSARSVVFGVGFGVLCWLIAWFIFITLSCGMFNPIDFIWSEWRTTYSRVIVVDPVTLKIISSAETHQDRLSFARSALVSDDGFDNYVTLGDEYAMKWLYHYSNKSIELDSSWTARYRTNQDGSFPGTGPTIVNDTVYWTDNTYPIQLGNGYRMFSKELTSSADMKQIYLTTAKPGFMFWSVAVSPLTNSVIVWDSANGYIQSRHMGNLSLIWQASVTNGDCLSVSIAKSANESKSYIYATELSKQPIDVSKWMQSATSKDYEFSSKRLIIINADNGKIEGNITIKALGDSIAHFPSLIVPGNNKDVIVGAGNSLIRIYEED